MWITWKCVRNEFFLAYFIWTHSLILYLMNLDVDNRYVAATPNCVPWFLLISVFWTAFRYGKHLSHHVKSILWQWLHLFALLEVKTTSSVSTKYILNLSHYFTQRFAYQSRHKSAFPLFIVKTQREQFHAFTIIIFISRFGITRDMGVMM